MVYELFGVIWKYTIAGSWVRHINGTYGLWTRLELYLSIKVKAYELHSVHMDMSRAWKAPSIVKKVSKRIDGTEVELIYKY